jgi:archaellum component FlaC
MPADVLSQLKDAMVNIDDNKLKSQIEGVMQSASESTASLNALKGIIEALTAGNKNLTDSLEKVVYYFELYSEKALQAQNHLTGFGSKIKDLETKPLQQISEALIKIEKEQKALSTKIDLFPGLNKTLSGLNNI